MWGMGVMGVMRMGGMRMGEKQFSPFTWGVHVRSHGCRGCILADGLAALEFALHRGD